MINFEVYKLWPVEPVKGSGAKLWDKDGKEYLDMYGGHAVISIGHSHPLYVEAIRNQVEKLGFYSNSVENSLQSKLAQKLGKISGYADYSLFLCNSGAEANENALKLASFHTGKSRILAFKGAFHGRTSGAVAATDNPMIRAPFNRSSKVTFIPMNDIGLVEKELSKGDYAAVIIEGIQGVAGIILPDDKFLLDLKRLCEKTRVMLIIDEVQSGYGRTGKFFAHQYAGIKPDMITTAKGMGNGFPIGGVLISPRIAAVAGMLGTTFGGNHLACTAAIAVIDVMEKEKLMGNSTKVGEYIISSLKDSPSIKELRGRGLMIGIVLKEGFEKIRERLLFQKSVFTGSAGSNVIRLLPPLNITKAEADRFIKAFKELEAEIQ
ncbi:MAG: aspartate aminotransferase family protein [Bacteroidales bacterium]|jgi:acetylornithine aminotransferase|nr:aspartate aminotransferase family protein [Bacteroidales bacterium]MDD2280486.1 aspartate aminotransferase family protein [Bacteroidales bacterium]MDD4293093.1 aspartate aminotransferase family protein [Bacteroidales bacterium]MDD4491270.1 aspartate aminotransferase family protein [Bacteroidales bacterium]HNW48506.1 aspartate aminotransferase family protein [Bacteroidales bacterium]